MIDESIMAVYRVGCCREKMNANPNLRTIEDFYQSWKSYEHILEENKPICEFLEKYLCH